MPLYKDGASGVVGGGGHESPIWVEIRLHTENQPPGYPGNGLKVTVGGVVTDQLHCLEMCCELGRCENMKSKMFILQMNLGYTHKNRHPPLKSNILFEKFRVYGT